MGQMIERTKKRKEKMKPTVQHNIDTDRDNGEIVCVGEGHQETFEHVPKMYMDMYIFSEQVMVEQFKE